MATLRQRRFVKTAISPELGDLLDRAAARDGRTVSEALRFAIHAYVEHVAARNDEAPGYVHPSAPIPGRGERPQDAAAA
jgi:hypothetical protein